MSASLAEQREPSGPRVPKLEWRGPRAYWRGQLVFRVAREANGRWFLHRHMIGAFKSKQGVATRKAGVEYAENLAKTWPEKLDKLAGRRAGSAVEAMQ